MKYRLFKAVCKSFGFHLTELNINNSFRRSNVKFAILIEHQRSEFALRNLFNFLLVLFLLERRPCKFVLRFILFDCIYGKICERTKEKCVRAGNSNSRQSHRPKV